MFKWTEICVILLFYDVWTEFQPAFVKFESSEMTYLWVYVKPNNTTRFSSA